MAAKWMQVIGPVRVVAVAVALLMLGMGVGCQQQPGTVPTTLEVDVAGERFTLELALDDASRFQGLSDREHIAPDGGMLFAFPEARPLVFVMRRCYVPIDVVFLGPNARVVTVHAMQVEPDPRAQDHRLKLYESVYPAQFALEFAGGTTERLNIQPGLRIDLPVDALKQSAK